MNQPHENKNPINKHLTTKEFRENRLWTLRDGVFYTSLHGYEVNEKEFSELYPVFNPITFVHTRENIDTTGNWMRS